jgi:hypothetical protein
MSRVVGISEIVLWADDSPSKGRGIIEAAHCDKRLRVSLSAIGWHPETPIHLEMEGY